MCEGKRGGCHMRLWPVQDLILCCLCGFTACIHSVVPVHSWFVHKWAAWCGRYQQDCHLLARLCTALSDQVLMGRLSQFLITSHASHILIVRAERESFVRLFCVSLPPEYWSLGLHGLFYYLLPGFDFREDLGWLIAAFGFPVTCIMRLLQWVLTLHLGRLPCPPLNKSKDCQARGIVMPGSGSGLLWGLVLVLLFFS